MISKQKRLEGVIDTAPNSFVKHLNYTMKSSRCHLFVYANSHLAVQYDLSEKGIFFLLYLKARETDRRKDAPSFIFHFPNACHIQCEVRVKPGQSQSLNVSLPLG